jgi:hypothetical protein
MTKRRTITDSVRVSSFGFNSSFVIRFSSFMQIRFIRVDEWLKICLLLALLRCGRLRFLGYRIHFQRRFAIHTHRSHYTCPVAPLF